MIFDEKYFDLGLDRRGTDCVKWDVNRLEHGEDAIPMFVADMDFPTAPAISQAVLCRAAHPTYGYTIFTDECRRAVCSYWQRHHGLEIEPEEIVLLPSVVTGLKLPILALTSPGDGVVIMSPEYGHFREAVESTDRTVMDAPLLHNPTDGTYRLNLAGIEEQLQHGAKLILFCNPHNPGSRVWSREELMSVAELADKYDAWLVSDEIHADFVYAPHVMTPMLTLRQNKTMSVCSPSKTFNLAGLQTAFFLCHDEEIRRKVEREIQRAGVNSGNIFGLTAAKAAYTDGDDWLEGLIGYLTSQKNRLAQLVHDYLPKAVLTPVTATYLAWLDLNPYGLSCEEIAERCEGKVTFTMGTAFGKEGEGFVRVNFACSKANLEEGIKRLAEAVRK